MSKLSPAQQEKLAKAVRQGKLPNQRQVRKDKNIAPKVPIRESNHVVPKEIKQDTVEPILEPGSNIIVFFDLNSDIGGGGLVQKVEYVPDQTQQLFELNQAGEINIAGLGKITLAGLNEKEAAARINLEPLLKHYSIRVMRLPLHKFGIAELKPFGYELFQQYPDEFAPDSSMPVPKDYIIGPGDEVHIQLIGKENEEYFLQVSRDSTLSLPGIGVFPVAGLHFDELKQDIKKRIKKQYIGVDAFITLGELRSIRVFVLGEVNHPGAYYVSGLSTMTNALQYGQGISTIGSLRNIKLKRSGKLVQTLDLYQLLLNGDTTNDKRLKPGDVIHVPTIKRSVTIGGEVRRPAIYELSNEKTLDDLITLAGGLLPSAKQINIKVERAINNEKELIELNIERGEHKTFTIRSGDIVNIDTILDRQENVVYLNGNVIRTGKFQWRQDLRLSDIIPNLRALKSNSDTEYVLVKRYLPPTYQLSIVSVSLNNALNNANSEDNLLLKPRDEVIVFDLSDKRILPIKPIIKELESQARSSEPSQVVKVSGQVRGPGQYPLEEGMRVTDLIIAGGRLSESAYRLDAELTSFVYTPGKPREVIHKNINVESALNGDEDHNLLLQAHDLLNIKEIPLWGGEKNVSLVGEVQFPGEYAIQRGETLHGILKRAGGLTPYAYPQGAVFIREDLQKREQERLDAMAANLEAELASISLERGEDASQTAQATQLLSKIRTTKAAGRLVIDLAMIADVEEDDLPEDHRIILRGGDRLFIPPKMQEVSVIGQVFHPTSHLFQENLSVDEYISLSGGMTKKADADSTYIVRANGAVQVAQNSWLDDTPDLYPGDAIVIPLDADRISSLKLWTNISSIVYQLGLSAAAWNTVGLF